MQKPQFAAGTKKAARPRMRRAALASLIFVAASLCPAQQLTASPAAPADPVHEQTLRTYFDMLHFSSRNWQALEPKFAQQKKQLPPGYPPAVWDEMVNRIQSIDIVSVVLPIYQKYWSDSVVRHATELFATPRGQQMAARMFGDQIQEQSAGIGVDQAYQDALHRQQAQEDQHIRAILAGLTAAKDRELLAFLQSAEWRQAMATAPLINKEMSAALIAKQAEIFQAVQEKHRDEIVAAELAWQQAHPEPAQH